jgi:hypothetical protein
MYLYEFGHLLKERFDFFMNINVDDVHNLISKDFIGFMNDDF